MTYKQLIKDLVVGEQIKVHWMDADSTHSWQDFSEDYCDHADPCESVGYVLWANADFLVLYATRSLGCGGDDEGEFMLTLRIPAGCIKRVFRQPRWGKKHEIS
jgi:hypothetical protein